MYCRAIACDFDGTGATDGRLALELSAALEAARIQGIVTVLATGRVLEDVQAACGNFSPFDAVVAENGGVVWLCDLKRTIQIGRPPPDHLLGELRSACIPFHTGTVMIGTGDRHAAQILELIRRFGVDRQLSFNRKALMLVPVGVNKAVGVRRALEELGRSERNLIAFGEAENDVPLLLAAEVGIAARGAVLSVAALADERLSQPAGAGVALYIRRLLNQGGVVPTPARRGIFLGNAPAGDPVVFPASGLNLVISGDPRSGKSWLAGLVAERLIEEGYRVCVIDPEGDHLSLGQRAKVLTFGHDLALPSAAALSHLLTNEPLSLVLDLSSLPLPEQVTYIDGLLCALEGKREATGMPHWILIDEAHYFFSGPPCSRRIESKTGNFILVTYRPSLISDEVYAHVGAHIITGSKVEEERYFATKLLQARAPQGLVPHDALAEIIMPRAGLLLDSRSGSRWQLFNPCARITAHAHHARKYADTRLPDDKAFRFLYTDPPVVAHNMLEFYNAVQNVPVASLRHHFAAGDFSRWVAEVLGDEQLARGLRKIERTTPAGATPNRAEILAHIDDHYLIGEE